MVFAPMGSAALSGVGVVPVVNTALTVELEVELALVELALVPVEVEAVEMVFAPVESAALSGAGVAAVRNTAHLVVEEVAVVVVVVAAVQVTFCTVDLAGPHITMMLQERHALVVQYFLRTMAIPSVRRTIRARGKLSSSMVQIKL